MALGPTSALTDSVPFRDPVQALEEKLSSLLDARDALDALIEATRGELDRWRAVRRRRQSHRRWRRMAAAMVPTLIETLVIGALLMGIIWPNGPSLASLRRARVELTRSTAQSLRSASVMFISENPAGPCPGAAALIAGGYIARSRHAFVDAWERPLAIVCEGDDVRVISAGPDGEHRTDDDIE